MVLTSDEAAAVKDELQGNFDLSGITLKMAAIDLKTTPEHIQDVLNLKIVVEKSRGCFVTT